MKEVSAYENAFTLVEIIVAMAILTIVFVGFYPIIISNNKVNRVAEQNLKAETIAQNAIEEIIHLARQGNHGQFVIAFPDTKNLIDIEIEDIPYKVEINYPDVEDNKAPDGENKVMRIKVLNKNDDKLLYETETWLVYAQ